MQKEGKGLKKLIVIILSAIIILGTIYHNKGILNMNKPTKEIPAKVLEFVGNIEYKHKIIYSGNWNNYDIFWVSVPELEKGSWGEPSFILYKDGKARKEKEDEHDYIMAEFYKN